MEIVIKIEDYDREWIANGYYIPDEINKKIAEAIIDGKPLPKGHGRLVDASVLKDKVASWLKPEKPDETEMISLDNALVSTIIEIEEAETIIEAEKENDNE